MQPREELTIRRAIRDGGLSERQELAARRALRDNPEDVSSVLSMLQPQDSTYVREGFGDLTVSGDSQKFDTKSGIKDFSLRAALGVADNAADEEKQLKQLFGMTETDYTRDSRGRLALTPSGGEKIGVQLEKPTLVDELGLSRYDFADLTGIAPELIGGVTGALKGAAAGSAFGPVGTVIGGAIGAGTGAAAGQAVEEVGEVVAGVQGQTFGEVASDVGREFKYGLIADLTFGTLGLGARGLGKLAKGEKLSPEDLKAAGESLEEGIVPTQSALGAGAVVARQERIAEQVAGSSPRLRNNFNKMSGKVQDFRSKYGEASDVETGTILKEGAQKRILEMQADERAVQQSIIDTLRDSAESIGAAVSKNKDLDVDIFNSLAGASRAFDDEVRRAYSSVDAAVDTAAGGKPLVRIDNLKIAIDDIKGKNKSFLKTKEANEVLEAFDAVNAISPSKKFTENATYAELLDLRIALGDILNRTRNNRGRDAVNDLLRKVDIKLQSDAIEDAISSGLIKDIKEQDILRAAGATLKDAQQTFNKGAKIFEEIEGLGVVKNLSDKARKNMPIGVDDVRLDKIIKNDQPERIKRVLDAATYGVAKDAKKGAEEEFRKKIAGQWLDDALSTSGISRIDDIDPTKFKPAAFAKSVRDLGRTADELFGPDAEKIRALANQIEKVSMSNIKQADVDALVAQLGPEATIVQKLTALRNAQQATTEANKSSFFRELAGGNKNEIDAAVLVANKNTTAAEVKRVMNFFEGDEAAIEKIRANYMERMMADFGDKITVNGDELKAFAKKLQEADVGGKLTEIYGKEAAEEIRKFARIVEINSRTAKGGDLVAANIAASPLENLGKLVKFSLLLRLFRGSPVTKEVNERYAREVKGEVTAEDKAKKLGQILRDSLTKMAQQGAAQGIQESVDEGERQVKGLISDAGLTKELDALRSQISSPNNFSALAPVVQAPQTAAPAAVPASQNNLRQQAKQNPGIAAALGIQGSTAGLI